ncbi:MAG: short-chain dehydrogenase [Bacillales bacterium]|jgi:NAD(P)-dependent dehydrogenase (short-subunit alcohol dehydrogenase family)|nr:short-chain dehydrogenase [Bacillales bacterium]
MKPLYNILEGIVLDFFNKTVVVTGGANGIGRCIVEEFLGKGANVAVVDIVESKMKNEKLHLFVGDITEESVLKEFSRMVLEKFGQVDFLINNACIGRKGILSGCSFDDFNYVLKLGVTAPYMLSSLFKNHFNDGASIVNISSTRAYMSQADTESYTAAKGGISALTHALSVSLAGHVRVNSISPGWIDTDAYQNGENYNPQLSKEDLEQHPAGRIGHPKDIAKMVLFLCSDNAGFITGQNINIDGGMTKKMIYHGDHGWKLID